MAAARKLRGTLGATPEMKKKIEKHVHFKGPFGKGPSKGRPKGAKEKPKALLIIPGRARGSEDDGNTAVGRNTAACAALSLGVHEQRN